MIPSIIITYYDLLSDSSQTSIIITMISPQTIEELKEFDNKVAHFEGTLDSFVIIDKPFSQGKQFKIVNRSSSKSHAIITLFLSRYI